MIISIFIYSSTLSLIQIICVAYIKLRAANLDQSLRIDFFDAQDDNYAAVSDICPIAEISRSNCGKAGTERNSSIDSDESIVLIRES